jgi:uncharacterized protein (UPF0335 family)
MNNIENLVPLVGNSQTERETAPPPIGDNVTKNAAAALRVLVEEKKTIRDDIRAVYIGAKGGGYNVPALRKIVALRKMKEGDRTQQDFILHTYKHAMGMLV